MAQASMRRAARSMSGRTENREAVMAMASVEADEDEWPAIYRKI
jgi:hypothetical protein